MLYEVTYEQEVIEETTALVEAESKEEAVQKAKDGKMDDFLESRFLDVIEDHYENVDVEIHEED
jgi:hypothetical protein